MSGEELSKLQDDVLKKGEKTSDHFTSEMREKVEDYEIETRQKEFEDKYGTKEDRDAERQRIFEETGVDTTPTMRALTEEEIDASKKRKRELFVRDVGGGFVQGITLLMCRLYSVFN